MPRIFKDERFLLWTFGGTSIFAADPLTPNTAFSHSCCSATSFGNLNVVTLCRNRCLMSLHQVVLQWQGLCNSHLLIMNGPVTKDKK